MFHGVFEGRVLTRTEHGILVNIGERQAFVPIADARLVDVVPGDLVRSAWRDDRPLSVTVTKQNGERISLEVA